MYSLLIILACTIRSLSALSLCKHSASDKLTYCTKEYTQQFMRSPWAKLYMQAFLSEKLVL